MAGLRTATNPETGEKVFFDEATGAWQPLKTATNPQTGEKLYKLGEEWVPMGGGSMPAQAAPALAASTTMTPDAATNPYTQDDTQYDPVTGVPIAGSFANANPTTETSPLGAMVSGGLKGLTFGLADEGFSALSNAMDARDKEIGMNTGMGDSMRAANEYADTSTAEYPGMAFAGEMAGLSKVPMNLIPGGTNAWTRGLAAAGNAGLFGAGYGATTAEEGERGMGALIGGAGGALAGGALSALGSVGSNIYDAIKRNSAIKAAGVGAPSTADARKMFGDQFKALADGGETIPQGDFPVASIMDDISKSAIDDVRLGGKTSTPGGESLVNDVMDIATDPRFADGVGFKELQELRQRAAELASETKDFKSTRDSTIGAAALDAIDNAIDQLGKSGQYKLSREGWARMLKSAKFDKILENADSYLAGGTSGITNQLKNLLKSPTQSRGFNEAEKKAIQAIIQGNTVEKGLRLAGGGLGRLAGTGGGLATGGVIGGAAAYGATNAAKSIAEAMTRGKTEALRKALVNGGLQNVPQVNQETLAKIIAALTRGSIAGVTGGQQ